MDHGSSAVKPKIKVVIGKRRSSSEKFLHQQMKRVRMSKYKNMQKEDVMADNSEMMGIVQNLEDKFEIFLTDMEKKKGFISAHVRARKVSLEMEKIFKAFRKASIGFDKAYKTEKKGE